MSFTPFATMQRALWRLLLCLLFVLPATLRGAPQGYALDFDGVDDSVEVVLSGGWSMGHPYTIGAWVYLRSGSTLGGKRTAVFSTPGCGGGVELLIRANTENPADPQFLELGQCGRFTLGPSTLPVPLRTWTHVAVTVAGHTVRYFINGQPAGSQFFDPFDGPVYPGATIRLGNNNEFRRFDGRLDDVMILNQALDPELLRGTYNNNYKGTEFPFMHAVFTFDEGAGSQLLDGAPAGGLNHGTLLGGPFWVRSGPTPPAVVRYEGTQQDFGGGWRTTSSNKSRDVDGDLIFGTDGHQFVNRAPAKPFYLASMEAVTGSYPGNERYAFIDDPENPGATFMTGTQNPAPGPGWSADVFRFTLNAHAIGRLVRVGVMIDHLDNAAYNPASLRLVQVTGGAAGTPPVATASTAYRNRIPDWVFFDISGGQTGDTFVVRGLGGPNGEVTVGGVVFDSMGPIGGRIRVAQGATPSPYPSRIHIAGLGGDIGKLTLKLNGIRAGSSGLGVLLVGPGGQKVRPMVSAGAGFNVTEGATLTLDDFATEELPTPLEGPIPSGRYRPQTDQGLAGDLPAPAPAGPYPSTLGKALDGPLNGVWSLYLSGFSGLIESWSLDFIPASPPTVGGLSVTTLGYRRAPRCGEGGCVLRTTRGYPLPSLRDANPRKSCGDGERIPETARVGLRKRKVNKQSSFMKSQTLLRIAVLAALSTGSCLGQAFTYQGLLQDGGQPANGVFDLSFGLFSAESGGTATATLQVNDLAVTNGVFTAVLDFPASSFIGAPRWIGLSVRPGAATGAFTALTPRQPVTSTPYAIHAGTVNASGLIGQVTDANLSATLSTPRAFTHPNNAFTGNGANLTGLNASQLTTGTLPVARLAPGSIGSLLLQDGAVGSAQVANGSLTAQDLSPSIGLWNAIGPAVVRPTGSVAIGRETTRVQFEVSGTMGHVQTHPHFAPADGTVLLGTYQGRTTNAAQLRFNRETPGAIFTDIGQHKDGQFVVEQNDIIRLMVRPDGRVGINTSNPGAALDVWGQMHVTEQGGIRSLGPRNTYAGMIEAWYGPNDRYGLAQLPNGITALYSSDFWTPSSIQFGQMTGADSFKSQVVIDHAGNFGINTLTPQARLEVVGDSADSFIGFGDGTGLVNFGAADKLHTTINEDQLASFNGNSPSTLYLNFSGGNVAIGQVPNTSARLHVDGEARATVFTPTSDRNAKQNFTSVNPREVLAKVAALSITEWSYKTIKDVRHIGPVAQDFYAAFGVGGDDKGISTVDADGVALAAIQGLNEKLGEKEAELLRLRAENQGLARRLGAIERALRMQGMDVEAK